MYKKFKIFLLIFLLVAGSRDVSAGDDNRTKLVVGGLITAALGFASGCCFLKMSKELDLAKKNRLSAYGIVFAFGGTLSGHYFLHELFKSDNERKLEGLCNKQKETIKSFKDVLLSGDDQNKISPDQFPALDSHEMMKVINTIIKLKTRSKNLDRILNDHFKSIKRKKNLLEDYNFEDLQARLNKLRQNDEK